MAKIALDLQRAVRRRAVDGSPGAATPRVLVRGDGWSVADVICTSGPTDRAFEEQHTHYSIAIVLAGTFQLRSPLGEALMAPGSLMLGNHQQCFQCRHDHGEGDRCVAFYFDPEYFERLARDVGDRRRRASFSVSQLPPLRHLAPLVAAASAGIAGRPLSWEELGVRLLTEVVNLTGDITRPPSAPANAIARITAAVRAVEREPDATHSIASLARHAGLSHFHFLRTFQRVVGLTPHQYVRRTRLHHAAVRLATDTNNVLDIALACGFGDVSNFNRAFRAEFGVSPTHLRHPRHLNARTP